MRQTAIIVGVAFLFGIAPRGWGDVLLFSMGFLLAALGGVAATTIALAGASMSGVIPVGFFLFLLFATTPPALHQALSWYCYFGLIVGATGVFMGLLYSSIRDEDDEDFDL